MKDPYIEVYNPNWPNWFKQEQIRLHLVLCGQLSLHHVGSTAVPGLMAKPCIDVLGIADERTQMDKVIVAMQSLGYDHRGEYGIKGRQYFVQNLPKKVHVHVFFQGAEEIKRHLFYVQYMRANPAQVERFCAIKQRLLEQYPLDKSLYQQEKAPFYDELFAHMTGVDG